MKTISTQLKEASIFLKLIPMLAIMLFMGTESFAQVTYTDTVCAATLDKVYGVTGSDPTSNYSWYISNPAAGTIDNSITANDSEIEIDWGTITGTVTLYVVETTADGCIGDSVQLDVVINPLPTIAIVSDSVCEGYSATLTVTLTGQAPWTIDYTDGTNTYQSIAASSPHTISLPTYTTSQTITITGVTDGNTCDADGSTLPSTGVVIFPKPVTGPIYHY